MDFYGESLPVFKCSLHTHSTVSDGDFAPAELVRRYREAGYDALAFSDHHKTNPVSTYDDLGMTLISGIELHPMGPREVLWHLLALGVPESLPGRYATAQEAVDAVRAAGGLIFCAHPTGYFTAQDILALHGLTGIEVANTNGRFTGRESNEGCWRDLIAEGWHCPAIAVDDTHTPCDLFQNWTMIAAPDRRPESLLKALASGHFYATQGPEFKRLSWHDGIFEAEFTEVVEALVYGFPGVDIVATPGFPTPETDPHLTRLVSRPGKNFRGHLRCRIRDARNRCAWSQPIAI